MKTFLNIIIFICILSMLSCIPSRSRRSGPTYDPNADIKATTNYELAHPVRRQPAPKAAPAPTYSQPTISDSETSEGSVTDMQTIEGSEGCWLIVKNQTGYLMDIKVNGVGKGTIPRRSMGKIGGLNCDGVMVEAWPQGSITHNSRAFYHNDRVGDCFYWTLKYR